MKLGRPEQRYLGELTRRLIGALADALVGVYLIGSAAMGDWTAGVSDFDVLVVSAAPLSVAAKRRVLANLGNGVLPCPARALELVVYRRDAVARPTAPVEIELNLNTGAGLKDRISCEAREGPSHWFVIDLAIARLHGQPMCGTRPEAVIGQTEEHRVLTALAQAVRWHETHDPVSANAVLNACRAWRYSEEHVWSSKTEAARWALRRGADAALLTRALALRQGASGELPGATCRALQTNVRERLTRSAKQREELN